MRGYRMKIYDRCVGSMCANDAFLHCKLKFDLYYCKVLQIIVPVFLSKRFYSACVLHDLHWMH